METEIARFPSYLLTLVDERRGIMNRADFFHYWLSGTTMPDFSEGLPRAKR